jgi:hypothetical protein
MTLALLIVGIFAVVAGLLSILFGISIRDFSLGSTLILGGTIGVCSGMLLIGLYVVVQELKGIARRLAGVMAPSEVRVRPVLPGISSAGMPAPEMPPAGAAKVELPSTAVALPPWQDEAAARERARGEAPPAPDAPAPAPDAPRRRNLMFASTSRKERERAQAKAAEGSPLEQPVPTPPATSEPVEPPPASFDDAWPKPERMRPPPEATLPRRPPSPRTPPNIAEPAAPGAPAHASEPPSAPPAEQPDVTLLKSGVVDGMAYSLYSDGSIEAQMPEGMMRFASIDELRSHLDQRGG